MSQIDVKEKGDGRFAVDVEAGGSRTSHQVTVPPEYLEQLGLSGANQTQVVRESFVFLLEREPPTSIMSSFELPVIERYFGEYPTEIKRRLA